MESKTTGGFFVSEFLDSNEQPCSLQESTADGDYIWLGLNTVNPHVLASIAPQYGIKTTTDVGWVNYPVPPAVQLLGRMHLGRAQVGKILPMLQQFFETGRLSTDAAIDALTSMHQAITALGYVLEIEDGAYMLRVAGESVHYKSMSISDVSAYVAGATWRLDDTMSKGMEGLPLRAFYVYEACDGKPEAGQHERCELVFAKNADEAKTFFSFSCDEPELVVAEPKPEYDEHADANRDKAYLVNNPLTLRKCKMMIEGEYQCDECSHYACGLEAYHVCVECYVCVACGCRCVTVGA